MDFTIKQARKYADKTIEEMANYLGVCRDTYRNMERNPEKCSILQASKIANICKIPMDRIIFLPDNSTIVE